MKYIGIPTCPYCRKKINIIRVWSIKKHGEFMCPRCKGISNIFLSPLTYVFAILAIAAGFLIYFFEKFVFDKITLTTPIQVIIPFAAFFFITLFMVYLEKPVIKKIKKTTDGRYFDQNGNELKMRFGKLVPANSATSQIPPIKENSEKRVNTRQQTDFVKKSQGFNYLQENKENLYKKTDLNSSADFSEDFKTTEIPDLGEKTKSYTKEAPVKIADKKAVANSETTRISLTEEPTFKRATTNEAPLRAPGQRLVNKETPVKTSVQRPARERPAASVPQAQKILREEAVARAAAQRPVRENLQPPAQPQRVKREEDLINKPIQRVAAPIEKVAEKENQGSETSSKSDILDFDLPIGKIAKERNTKNVTRSGFEDIIEGYSKPASTGATSRTSSQPSRRRTEKEETPKKSSGFRQL